MGFYHHSLLKRDFSGRLLVALFVSLGSVAQANPADLVPEAGCWNYSSQDASLEKLTDVYDSGTKHEEHQPVHLLIEDTEVCATRCLEEYGNPCTKFCPAQVYNMRPNEETGRLEMEIDFSNCVHCKTCDIRDPYQIITWVPPEGGGGPEYHSM